MEIEKIDENGKGERNTTSRQEASNKRVKVWTGRNKNVLEIYLKNLLSKTETGRGFDKTKELSGELHNKRMKIRRKEDKNAQCTEEEIREVCWNCQKEMPEPNALPYEVYINAGQGMVLVITEW